MKRFAASAALLAAFALAGCQTVETRNEACPSPPHENYPETELMLFEAAGYRTMNAAELGVRAEALRQTYAAHHSEENRLRLVLFLALAPAPQGDRSRALALLDLPPSDANGRGRTHPLAALLIPLLQDKRRLEDALGTKEQRLRDETRRGDTLQQNNDALQKKLDSIREIERGMLERNTQQAK